MSEYNVVITETEVRTYEVAVSALDPELAEDMAHDILVNADDKLEEYLSYELYEMETNAEEVE